MNSNIEFDAVQFLLTTFAAMRSDVNSAYVNSVIIDEDRADVALQTLDGKLKTLQAFVNAIKSKDLPTKIDLVKPN